MSLNDAIDLAIGSLRESSEKDLTEDTVEIAKISKESRTFEKLSSDEIKRFLKPTKPKKE